ncbi:AMP-binding protein [Oryzomicrobium sp.]|uniref:AMP-binding protein n=1 Tax=Oryzomicrobium sp. TaxID=1911578 RepID=UPI0025D79AA5|nr:AMP-binding protein [Oryzomicrobium sp.]MCE1243733.1 AMP-binding protein [Oryzomicrobium sp.]
MHLNQLFQRTVRLHGDRPALARGRGPSLTYRQLERRVAALAGWLRHDLGLQPGDRVTLAMKNCIQYAESMLAIWHAGLCAVPVNAKLHPNELEYVLHDSGSAACLSSGELYRGLLPVAERLPGLQLIDVEADGYTAALGRAPIAPVAGNGGDLAWLFYTSGTTGRPKGVMLTHDNLLATSLNFYADVQPVDGDDVLVHVAPMSHGSGLYSVPYFIRGALQVVPESGGFDEAELFELLGHYRSASLFAAPTIVQRMAQHAADHGSAFPGLRALIVGGAPFYVEDIKAAVACFGPRIAQIYGQGESPMSITALSAEQTAAAVAGNDLAMLASVGASQTSVEVAVLGPDGQPAPAGTLGEVVARGPSVMKGYWNNPDATRQTLAGGWLHTGDVGVLDERGLLQLKDRSKDVIISGGTNIYPREVEEVLLQHAAVQEVSVIGVPDREWGESIAAFVVCRDGMAVGEADLEALCLRSIARFKRPRWYFFVAELPKNGTGKVLKTQLRKLATPTS